MRDAFGDFLALLRTLIDGGVEFTLIGGLALNYHGVGRATEDVDIVPAPSRENVARLRSALDELKAHVPGADPRFDPLAQQALESGATALCLTKYGPLHIVQGEEGMPAFDDLIAASEEAVVEGITIKVCSREHLVQMKRAAGRPQDEIDLEDLRRAEGDLD